MRFHNPSDSRFEKCCAAVAASTLVVSFALAVTSPVDVLIQHSAVTPTEHVFDDNGVSGYALHENGIYWWSGQPICDGPALIAPLGDIPHSGAIRYRDTLSGQTVTVALDCEMLEGAWSNVVRAGSYFYFFKQGALHRKHANADVNDPPEMMANTPSLSTADSSAFQLVVNDRLYWSSPGAVSSIYSRDLDPDAAAVLEFLARPNSVIIKLEWFIFEGASNELVESFLILYEDGILSRRPMVPPGAEEVLASGVVDFATLSWTFVSRTDFIFAVTANDVQPVPLPPPGALLRIDAATADVSTIYTGAGTNQLLSVATDSYGPSDQLVYFTEASYSCGVFVCILDYQSVRMTDPVGGAADTILIDGGTNLYHHDRHLYFNTELRIYSLPTRPEDFIFSDGFETV